MPASSQTRLPKVTESLRRQWANQRSQSIEERTEDQSGRPRPPEGVWEQDFDVALMDALLALPLGTRFDARQIQDEVRAAMTSDYPGTMAAPAGSSAGTTTSEDNAYRGTTVPGAIRGEGSTTLTYDAEMQAFEGDLWTVKASEFPDEAEAWEWIGVMRKKPVWAPCFWRVVEVRRKTSGMVWGPTTS
jgi:hypothetical protein